MYNIRVENTEKITEEIMCIVKKYIANDISMSEENDREMRGEIRELLEKEMVVEEMSDKILRIYNELYSAVKEGYIEEDDFASSHIVIYREASETSPAGWYSEDMLDVARELANDRKLYLEFKKTLEEVRKENSDN